MTCILLEADNIFLYTYKNKDNGKKKIIKIIMRISTKKKGKFFKKILKIIKK